MASADTGASMELAIASSKAGKNRKDKKAISTAPVFRAVAANGADVWAGGTAAVPLSFVRCWRSLGTGRSRLGICNA